VIDANLAALSKTQLLTEKELSAVTTNAISVFPSLRDRIPAS
jgi:hypothetical protein